MPYSESGDWYIEYRHYFDDNGKTFAFSRLGNIFADVKGGLAMEILLKYYDDNFKTINQTYRLTDKDEKNNKNK